MHLGPGILYVIDVHTNRLVKAIPGVPEITGLEYVRSFWTARPGNRSTTQFSR